MRDYSFILKRLGIFLAVYIGLSLLFSIGSLSKAQLSFFYFVGQPIVNMIHTGSYIDFTTYKGEPMNKWDTSFAIYEQAKYPKSVYKKSYRKTVPAGLTMHKGLREMVVLPSIFLFALFMATPLPWKKKLISTVFGILLLYLIICFHINYNIRFTQLGGDFEAKSVGDILSIPFGGNFIDEHFFFVGLLIWALLTFSAGLHKQLLK